MAQPLADDPPSCAVTGAPWGGGVTDLCSCSSFLRLPVRIFSSLSSRTPRLLASPLGAPSPSLARDVLAPKQGVLLAPDSEVWK
jgi:hypothetical protein